MAVYNIDEHLTSVLKSAMRICFMSHLLVLVLVLVLLQLVLTTTLWLMAATWRSSCFRRYRIYLSCAV